MIEKIKYYFPLPVVVAISLLIWVISSSINDRVRIKDAILKHPSYSIGTVTSSSAARSGGLRTATHSSGSVRISFYEQGVIREARLPILYISDTKYVGKRFVVIYDSLDFENCVLLYKCPVRDSSEFLKYLYEFKANPKLLKVHLEVKE